MILATKLRLCENKSKKNDFFSSSNVSRTFPRCIFIRFPAA